MAQLQNSLPETMELWGGVEPTVNRIGDVYHDQGERSGFWKRPDDIARFAQLGIKALRFPILWERVERRRRVYSWDDLEQRLETLERFGVRPIVTLLHHGSGPRWTNLLDPDFPKLFAEYAHAVACRFPQIGAYTPVNEPLTTARFSALYGVWYPHARDDASFVRALLAQLYATVDGMRAIRATSPLAELVVTEDIGTTHAMKALRYQADFENERRWLSLDILCGRFTDESILWRWLQSRGMDDGDAAYFAESALRPQILGINYYITSERWLDHRIERYPLQTHGGNGFDTYADVEAVRGRASGIAGWKGVLRSTWERYRHPLAITEVHLGDRPEEQMRWLWEAWTAAREARKNGIDVRALTAWSLLGCFDWNSLVTRIDNHYEPGAFSVRNGTPRETELASMLRSLAAHGTFEHPALAHRGWWRKRERLWAFRPATAQEEPEDKISA